jgi:hypothetical protein
VSKKIKLANGRGVAVVDDADYERIGRHSWCLLKGSCRVYAQANIKIDGVWRRVAMHRFIVGAKKGERVDHEDRDGLNNRRSNLRHCSDSQNQHNRGAVKVRKGKKTTSRYKGVSWSKVANKWLAQIMANRKPYYLGLYETQKTAARAYDTAARILHKGFAVLNFPALPPIELPPRCKLNELIR